MIYNLSLSYWQALLIGIGMVAFAIYRKSGYNQRLRAWLQSLPAVNGIHIKKVNAYQYFASYKAVSGHTATMQPGIDDIFNTTRKVTIDQHETLGYTSKPVFEFKIENTGNITYKRVTFFYQEHDKHGPVHVNQLLGYFIEDLRPKEKKQLLVPHLNSKNRLVLDSIELVDTNNRLVNSIKPDKEMMPPPYRDIIPFSLIVLLVTVLAAIETFRFGVNGTWAVLFLLSFFLLTRSMGGAIFTLLALGIGVFSFLLGSNIVFLLCMLYVALAWGRLKSPVALLSPSLANTRF
ncbi:hypothetical protein [Chitinophaga sp. MM2321]|uniref:hypothetical protein n=1 Tax=Chitinophaga sp. MM2321 TaxID=3137178 RepID=UPI0032D57B05